MMKTIRLYCMLAVMVLCTVAASAQWNNSSQPYSSPEVPTATFRSTSAMQGTGSQHQLQVREAYAPDIRYKYIPMRSTSTMIEVPTISTPQFEEEDPNPAIRRGRKGFDTGGESGRSDEYPVGEPWVMLLFAAAAAGAAALRRYRRRPAAVTSQDNTPVQ